MKLIFQNTDKTFLNYNLVFLLSCFGFIMMTFNAYGQQDSKLDTINVKQIAKGIDTTMVQASYNKQDATQFKSDTSRVVHNDVSPLDIGSDRGIFILSANQMLQLRILGSVRARFNYSNREMSTEQTFNPYEIPTGTHSFSPNFYAGLKQTRLGFEVTRRTKNKGDIFIRIEGDFKTSDVSFRIRHAYGQIGNLLVGQTWSLFNNVSYQPAMVSRDGPAGGIGPRTPQIRYSHKFHKDMSWSAAIEYSSPDLEIPDSVDASLLQAIPDFTGRYSYQTDLISFRVAAVISTISGRIDSGSLSYEFGFGGSFSGWMKIKKQGRFYLSLTSGTAISHFMDMFDGKGEDIVYDPQQEKFKALVSTGGYLAYSHNLPKDFSASLSFGMAAITNKNFQTDDAYSYSYNALLNVFWNPVEGARIGIEYANGQRFDKGDSRGPASRVSLLLYYDF